MSGVSEIRKFLRGSYVEKISLKEKTWYQIGGPCEAYCKPVDAEDLAELVRFCEKCSLPFFLHGKGSNLLISDAGIPGVVIDLTEGLDTREFSGQHVKVGAGAFMPKFSLECEKQGLSGIEMFAGIPGTLGGMIRMNAGCHGREIFDAIESVEIMEHGKRKMVDRSEIEVHYRHVPMFDDGKKIILGATLRLDEDRAVTIAKRRKEYMEKRRLTQPINLPSTGSVFKNPKHDHAARLIEQAGLKGFKIGGARVSEKHANFIVNEGGAKAEDVLAIMKHVRKTVIEKYDVTLELEVQFVGFEKNEIEEVVAKVP